MKFLNRNMGPMMEDWTWGSLNSFNYEVIKKKTNLLQRIFIKQNMLKPAGGPDTVENIKLNAKFDITSVTSLQSVMTNDTMWLKMNFGYSTSRRSDFYYGSNIIDKFENLNSAKQAYRTTIVPE